MNRKVFLTGFMATGKTTIGPLLAERLGMDFIDLDSYIEAHAGKTVAEIFAQEGEAGFRARETRALVVAASRDGIIALGGGALLSPENRTLILQSGALVALTASIDEIVRRVGSAQGRPLLTQGKTLRDQVEQLLRARTPLYQSANFTVDTTDRAPRDVAFEIVQWIASR